jgi:hypothetical protein
MKAWYAVPSARLVKEAQRCFDAWREMGFAVAATRKLPDLRLDMLLCLPTYSGLWNHTNILAKQIIDDDPECQVIASGGDDCWPDPTKRADEIVDEFVEHFGGTLGVMVTKGPTPGHDRCAWAPFLGREWCERAFEGRGPTEPAFWHNFGDAYLYEVAERLGLLWERNDLEVAHHKWNLQSPRQRPPHLLVPRAMWAADNARYQQLVADSYPGSELAS